MKIGNGNGLGQVDRTDRGTTTSSAGRASQSDSGTSVSSTESVQLSGFSSRLQDLEKTLSASPAFDAQKVESITQAIRDGKFTVNSDVVADKLLASVRELVGN
ncbi:flagellar biosynthesis anti-sigma factor FlgM [Parvibium lacunae]|uniref:Negative regulator of flagellin synthesis n=1 Tax=Parvibium lacunae TaxID=1888893 RepID=A0A368L3Z0_9BURK|nr:flagellar biosynthesis anti-sigma factor FlgM [Parvibium lacunae]RCS58203.1 flagellar biosynthesis anti-sigma factor FlgM [Parvibium lacunae]